MTGIKVADHLAARFDAAAPFGPLGAFYVISAIVGTQVHNEWIPAFAGMTCSVVMLFQRAVLLCERIRR
jgi:hypothetical protein